MKNMKIGVFSLIFFITAGCSSTTGELVGIAKSEPFKEANPFGMVFIRSGSFIMGENAQSAFYDQPDNSLMVTVSSFWMDETEITNNEYKQFIQWVRDSMALKALVEAGMTEYAFVPRNEEFDEENYTLNWNKKIPWDSKEEEIKEALGVFFYSDGSFNYNTLHYRYSWKAYDQASLVRNRFDVTRGTYPPGASVFVDTFWIDENNVIQDSTIERPLRSPSDLITNKIICIYPDTLCWVRDFQYSYNDPLLLHYFSHPGYLEYPVVGVTWDQAHAFCNWRTFFYDTHATVKAQNYRLPTESEWEFAARGGRKVSTYPWGGNYVRNAEGCFYANFKPYRGVYSDDTGATPMRVAQFKPNDFGLFDMAGNVSEWTGSAYQKSANTVIHDLNPDYSYMSKKSDPDVLKRKIVKGGSWKDISYYLRCGSRYYEYEFESRCYIGFRCVRSYIGDN